MKRIQMFFLMFLMALALFACEETTMLSLVMSPPTGLEANGRIVTWDAVEGATKYQIQIGTLIVDVNDTEYVFNENDIGEYAVAIRAGYRNVYSEFSEPIVVQLFQQLEIPIDIHQSGTKVVWDQVEYATGYVVKYGGIEYYTTLTQYNVDVDVPTNVEILSVGSETTYRLNSGFSEAILFQVQLNQPQDIRYEDDKIVWDEVPHANGYLLQINGGDPIDLDVTEYQLHYAYAGSIAISVVAYSEETGYLDSDAASANITCPTLDLATPASVVIVDGVLTFIAVEHASNYEIYVNGQLYATITDNTYNIPSAVSDQPDAYLQVRAVSSIHNDSDLSTLVYVNTNVITTEAELQAMSQYGSYILGNDIIITGEWTPIVFSGTLDGNDHQIAGLLITTANDDIGLFSVLDNAVVKNLSVSGSIIVASAISGMNIGGLAGKVNASRLENISVSVDLTCESDNGIGSLGGVFGRIESVDLDQVTYDGTINAMDFIVGGFAGTMNDPSSPSVINRVMVSGGITANGGEQTPAGGFIGILVNNNVTISESIVRATIVGPVYVGGFVGYLGSGHIENSYVQGSVEATSAMLIHVGGFVGRLEGYNVTLTDCLAMTLIVSGAEGQVFAGSFSGSTPGGAYGTIYSDCFYDNEIATLPVVGNNGVASGISGSATAALVEIAVFDQDIWDLSGTLPRLSWETPE